MLLSTHTYTHIHVERTYLDTTPEPEEHQDTVSRHNAFQSAHDCPPISAWGSHSFPRRIAGVWTFGEVLVFLRNWWMLQNCGIGLLSSSWLNFVGCFFQSVCTSIGIFNLLMLSSRPSFCVLFSFDVLVLFEKPQLSIIRLVDSTNTQKTENEWTMTMVTVPLQNSPISTTSTLLSYYIQQSSTNHKST